MENAAGRLQKEAKGYLDSLRGMSLSLPQDPIHAHDQIRLADSFCLISNDRLTNAHRRDHRRILWGRWCQ